MATTAERANMEEAALEHAVSGIVQVIAYGSTSSVHDGPAFFIYAIACNKRENAEALVWV